MLLKSLIICKRIFAAKNDVIIVFTRMSESDDEQFFDALDESDDIQREWDLMMVSLKVDPIKLGCKTARFGCL